MLLNDDKVSSIGFVISIESQLQESTIKVLCTKQLTNPQIPILPPD